MALFELIVDERVSVWKRSYVTVKAESLEEAVKNCVEEGADAAEDILDSEYIYESEDLLPVSDSDRFTIEVMDRHLKTLGSNETVSK